MPATVICFERFRLVRESQDGREGEVGSASEASVPFLHQPGVPLTMRQVEHREAMLAHGRRLLTAVPRRSER